MEEVHECDFSRRDFFVRIVVVPAKEIAIVAGRDLRFQSGNREQLVSEPWENARETSLHRCRQRRSMGSNIQQDARSPMFEVNRSPVHAG